MIIFRQGQACDEPGRFFRRLPVEKPMVRNNYFFQARPEGDAGVDVEELGWATSMVGGRGRVCADGGPPWAGHGAGGRGAVEDAV